VARRTPETKYSWSSTGQHSFFDLAADAKETQNLFGDGRPPQETRTRVEQWRVGHGLDRTDTKLDPLTEERLKLLGYL